MQNGMAVQYIQDLPTGIDKFSPGDSNPENTKDTVEMSVTVSQLSIYQNLEGFSSRVKNVPKDKLGPHIIRRCVICYSEHITCFCAHLLQIEIPDLKCGTWVRTLAKETQRKGTAEIQLFKKCGQKENRHLKNLIRNTEIRRRLKVFN